MGPWEISWRNCRSLGYIHTDLGERHSHEWVWENFGHTRLGDIRRSSRDAAASAERPDGTVSGAFRDEFQAVRRLSPPGKPKGPIGGGHRALYLVTTNRFATHALAYVAIDGSSLTLHCAS